MSRVIRLGLTVYVIKIKTVAKPLNSAFKTMVKLRYLSLEYFGGSSCEFNIIHIFIFRQKIALQNARKLHSLRKQAAVEGSIHMQHLQSQGTKRFSLKILV